MEDGRTRVRGAKESDKLLATLKGQRTEVIEEWQRQQEQARDRYAVVPSGDVPMCGRDIELPTAEREAAIAHMFPPTVFMNGRNVRANGNHSA
jgi:hypothetical protein